MQWLIQDFAREGSESSGQEGMGCETRLYRLPKHFSLLLEIVYYGEFSMVFFKLAESALPMGNRTVESALSIKFLRRASRNIPHFQGCGLNIGLDDVDFFQPRCRWFCYGFEAEADYSDERRSSSSCINELLISLFAFSCLKS